MMRRLLFIDWAWWCVLAIVLALGLCMGVAYGSDGDGAAGEESAETAPAEAGRPVSEGEIDAVRAGITELVARAEAIKLALLAAGYASDSPEVVAARSMQLAGELARTNGRMLDGLLDAGEGEAGEGEGDEGSAPGEPGRPGGEGDGDGGGDEVGWVPPDWSDWVPAVWSEDPGDWSFVMDMPGVVAPHVEIVAGSDERVAAWHRDPAPVESAPGEPGRPGERVLYVVAVIGEDQVLVRQLWDATNRRVVAMPAVRFEHTKVGVVQTRVYVGPGGLEPGLYELQAWVLDEAGARVTEKVARGFEVVDVVGASD
jgi:hypothetical protein